MAFGSPILCGIQSHGAAGNFIGLPFSLGSNLCRRVLPVLSRWHRLQRRNHRNAVRYVLGRCLNGAADAPFRMALPDGTLADT